MSVLFNRISSISLSLGDTHITVFMLPFSELATVVVESCLQVENGAETGIQELNCLVSPVRLSLSEQLPLAVPMGLGQTSQADPGSVGPQAENFQGSTCEVCTLLASCCVPITEVDLTTYVCVCHSNLRRNPEPAAFVKIW
jgi:hypothetical protein